MNNLSKSEILDLILEDVDLELSNEEIIHDLVQKQVTKSDAELKNPTFGDRAADALAKFAGSWKFVIGFSLFLVAWIVYNNLMAKKAFDPFPYILLNLLLSCLAAVQAPLIMMSQNRQEEKDRQRSMNDYRVNLKTEVIIGDIHKKLDLILLNQGAEAAAESEGEASKEEDWIQQEWKESSL